MSKVRICPCCGNKYTFCPNCDKDPSWKMLYDTETCRDITNIISAYSMRMISKNKAYDMLSQIHIDDISRYTDNVVRIIHEIQDVSVVKPKRKRKRKS